MTNETTQAENTGKSENSNLPKYAVKVREGYGKNATYERIGVAWDNKDGSIYVKLHGTQVIDRGFTLYEFAKNDQSGEKPGE